MFPGPDPLPINRARRLSSPIKREVHDAEKAQKEAEELGHEDPAAYQRVRGILVRVTMCECGGWLGQGKRRRSCPARFND